MNETKLVLKLQVSLLQLFEKLYFTGIRIVSKDNEDA